MDLPGGKNNNGKRVPKSGSVAATHSSSRWPSTRFITK
jgi:hypothetical protein